MTFTASKRMVEAIDRALSFSHSILFVEPIPTLDHIQDLWDSLASASHVDVQTEIMENDNPKGVLHYYLELFAPILSECNSSGEVICPPSRKEGWEDDGTGKGVLKITSKEPDLRDRLKREGLEPSLIDLYIERWQNVCDILATRIEDVFDIFDRIDWRQLRGYLFDGVRVDTESLRPFFANEDALEMFLLQVKDKSGADTVHEVFSAYKCKVIKGDPRNTGKGTLHEALEKNGFKVQQPSGWRRAFDGAEKKPINRIYYKFTKETD